MCNPDRTKRAIQTEQNVHSGLHKTCNPDRTKRADFTTTVVDTNNINVVDHTNNAISCNSNQVDYVVDGSSFLQDSFFYKEELCLLNTHAEQSSALCSGQGQTNFCENDVKGRKQTDLLLTAGSSRAHDKDDDAIGNSTPAHHSLTVLSTIAETKGACDAESGNDAETEGAGALNSENAQESFIGNFLVRDIPNIVTEQENAPERLETALKRKLRG
jgi:hypothetical protein